MHLNFESSEVTWLEHGGALIRVGCDAEPDARCLQRVHLHGPEAHVRHSDPLGLDSRNGERRLLQQHQA